MKKFFLSIVSLAVIGFATSCSSDDDGPSNDDDGGDGNVIIKSGILTENETWTADNIYILDGKVVVDEGLTLTIKAGTIIKGEEGDGSLASALVVDQGGKLNANGTADNPIIFTSVLDNIEVGQKAGTNLSVDDTGLWGGVIVLGRAPISVSGDLETAQIEGIPANEPYGQYGGTNPNDNSGSIQYISIRHGGISIGQDNEINGLTLGGVGSGTIINHVEIVANQDDGIEWFGGTVNSSNLITWAHGDDGFDTDQAYSGTISNGLIIQAVGSGSALELDGPEGSAATEDSHTIQNVTIIGGGTNTLIADVRDGLLVELNNILAYNFGAEASVNINGDDSLTEFLDGRLSFSNWNVVLPSGVSLENLITFDTEMEVPAGSETLFTDNVTVINSAADANVGANTGVFGWTYAATQNAF